MKTLFDLDDIPEKQPATAKQYEYVITLTDTDDVQWFYASGVGSEQGIRMVRREDRKLPKRYKALHLATRFCKEVNKQRSRETIAAGVVARVVVWEKL